MTACLRSLAWVDDLIVVDAESTDRTVEIAKSQGARVFIRPWPGYGRQKNYGIEQAKGDWILIVDADERVTQALHHEILVRLESAPAEVVGFAVPRRNFFYGIWVRGGGMWPDYQVRLFRRNGRYDDRPLHEHLELQGRIERLAAPLDHATIPTVSVHVTKMRCYTTLGAQDKLAQGRGVRIRHLAFHHVGTVLKTYGLRRGYRDGVAGLVVALFAGMHTFVKYAKTYETLTHQAEGSGVPTGSDGDACPHAHRH